MQDQSKHRDQDAGLITEFAPGRLLLLAFGFYVSAQIGFASAVRPENVSILWPPSGYLLGVLLLHAPRLWPRILLACLPVDLAGNLVYSFGGTFFSILTSLVDCAEPLIMAFTIRAVLRRPISTDRPGDILWLIALATPANLLASVAGSMLAVGWQTTESFVRFAAIWFLADFLGVILIVPVFLNWNAAYRRQLRALNWKRRLELGFSLASLIGCVLLLFGPSYGEPSGYWLPLPYLVFPFIIWLCLRFNPLVASLATAFIGLMAAWFTLRGCGPFALIATGPVLRGILAQTFSGIVSLTALIVGAVLAQRRLAEAGLRVSEERLGLALQGADMIMWDWDVTTGRIILGENWAGKFELPSSENQGDIEHYRGLVHPDDLARIDAMFADLRQDKLAALDLEIRIRSQAGGYVWILCRGKALEWDANGLPQRLVGTALDLTQRKRAEEEKARLQEQFLQAQKMELVGQLAGGVAHDLNNLLTPVIGYTEMALWTLNPKEPLYANLEQVIQAGQKAKNLTRRLLAFGRKQALELTNVNLNELISSFTKILRRTIRENIELELELGSGPDTIVADASQLEQVLMNLAVNSQDAMPQGGKLTVRTEAVSVGEGFKLPLKPGRWMLLEVKDTGEGMDEATLSRIFEPFFTTKESDKGTGLGLATVYGIVQQHEGHVSVVSRPGEGAIFSVYLPALEPGVAGTAEAPPFKAAEPGHGTLLVVEDEAAVRSLICRLLSNLGYEVIEAARPSTALHISENFTAPIDLLITDVIMPQMNGRELYRRLAESRPKLKVLYMSGYSGAVIAEHGILEDGGELIHKPFTMAALTEKIRALIPPEE